MESMHIIAFLPCRKGSERVKRKNIRDFADIEGGLTKIKIQQLIDTPEIDEIIVSTDDEEVINICSGVLEKSDKSFVIDRRPKHLASSETSTDDLINYAASIIPSGNILWTHVTSPFITSHMYSKSIKTYKDLKKENIYDSLVSVTKLQKFFLNTDGTPVNYDPSIEKWPRTQTIEPLYEINSGIFINSLENYRQFNDRLGNNPFMYELSSSEAMDIDWEEDFELAEYLWGKNK